MIADLQGSRPIDLVLVGHFGFTEQHTPFGSAYGLGGSGYACALGASVGHPGRIGIVAYIGEDFDLTVLDRMGIDRRGAITVPGSAPRLKITEYTPTDRSFVGDLGAASQPATDAFPPEYYGTRHLHLATMPPSEQLAWFKRVRPLSDCTISVDMFEIWASEFPDLSRELCYSADLVFMNEREHQLLFSEYPLPPCDFVVKNGADGAYLRSSGRWIHASAPPSDVVDTTNAGEILAGSFLALRALGVEPGAALTYSVRLASAKVVELGLEGRTLDQALSNIRSEVAGLRSSNPGLRNARQVSGPAIPLIGAP